MRWSFWFLSLKGRINRGEYWLAQFIWGLVFVLFFIIGMRVAEKDMTSIQDRLFYVGIIPIICGLVYSTCAVAIKRFHHRDKSGWWIVPLILLPSTPGHVIERFAGQPFEPIWNIASTIVLFWVALELGCFAGTAGPNRFGDAPATSEAWGEQ